jgi:hypothetical protein
MGSKTMPESMWFVLKRILSILAFFELNMFCSPTITSADFTMNYQVHCITSKILPLYHFTIFPFNLFTILPFFPCYQIFQNSSSHFTILPNLSNFILPILQVPVSRWYFDDKSQPDSSYQVSCENSIDWIQIGQRAFEVLS